MFWVLKRTKFLRPRLEKFLNPIFGSKVSQENDSVSAYKKTSKTEFSWISEGTKLIWKPATVSQPNEPEVIVI